MNKRSERIIADRRARVVRARTTPRKRAKTFLAYTGLGILSLVAIVLIYGLITFVQVSRSLPSLSEIGNFQPSDGTCLYYSDGTLLARLATENRTPIKLNQISKQLVDATIATEDRRFYEHSGVDIHGILRAIYRNVQSGDPTSQGASTITQQLARNINELGLTHEKRMRRKIAEAILAMRLEQSYTKDEILEMYLNQVYYGNGAYGVEAASESYFGKHAKDLSLAQSALLAGMPQSPSVFSKDHDAAMRRRNWVLDSMTACGKITSNEREIALQAPINIHHATPHGNQIYGAPYFVNFVVSRLEREFGSTGVYSGWKIYTTLDRRIQQEAERCLHEGINEYGQSANQAALISIDPKTGHIRAMVGGLDYERDQFNVVSQGNRQPGSSFKPIIYTAGINEGVCDLEKTYRDDPDIPGEHAGNKWHPKNYGGKYSYSSVTVLNAIKHSLNTISVKVAMETGLEKVIEYAHRMGITSKIEPYPTLALGAWGSGVKPIDLCSAYTVFANNGMRCLPNFYTRIVAANNDIIDEPSIKIEDPNIGPETITAMNTALREVILHGTGTAASEVPDAHGKTGTTSDNKDAWFAGYTPELTTVIWAAREARYTSGKKKGKVHRYLEMPGATGGHVCAPIWRNFMLKAVPLQQEANKATTRANEELTNTDNPKTKVAGEKTKRNVKQTTPLSEPTVQTVDTQPGEAPADTHPGSSPSATIPSAENNGGDAATGVDTSPIHSPVHSDTLTPDNQTRAVTPETRRDPGDDMVTVSICAETGKRATRWCPDTIEKRMHRRDQPSRCKLHHAPPGEPE